MEHALDTTRIFKDEDTDVVRTIRCVMPYADMSGPFEDMSYMFPDYPYVTAFRDDIGELIMVLEPLQKVVDSWIYWLENQNYKSITFGSQ